VYISHRGMEEVLVREHDVNRETIWQPVAPNPELEAEMLRRLAVRFGVEEQRSAALIANAQSRIRASITRDSKGAADLALYEPFDRAWRRVGLALDRVGFAVEDRNRSEGLYYVRYIDPEADGAKQDDGWLSKLAFWSDGDKNKQGGTYRIRVTEAGEQGSAVSVLNEKGNPDKSATANRILNLLYEQLK
ncbi:MAG: outer membrane protein assembly factor BamC, partial [Burkholderiales bacterium]